MSLVQTEFVQNAQMMAKKQKLEGDTEDHSKILCVTRLTEFATIPTRGSSQAAGYDLYSAYDQCIKAGEKALMKTDLAVAIPEGCYGRVGKHAFIEIE